MQFYTLTESVPEIPIIIPAHFFSSRFFLPETIVPAHKTRLTCKQYEKQTDNSKRGFFAGQEQTI